MARQAYTGIGCLPHALGKESASLPSYTLVLMAKKVQLHQELKLAEFAHIPTYDTCNLIVVVSSGTTVRATCIRADVSETGHGPDDR